MPTLSRAEYDDRAAAHRRGVGVFDVEMVVVKQSRRGARRTIIVGLIS
jgi:hypothetical protein